MWGGFSGAAISTSSSSSSSSDHACRVAGYLFIQNSCLDRISNEWNGVFKTWILRFHFVVLRLCGIGGEGRGEGGGQLDGWMDGQPC